MIEITGLRKSFGPVEVLRGIDLTVNEGEVVALIGRSGCGKSTLLRCINFLEDYDAGEIRMDNQLLWHQPQQGGKRIRQSRTEIARARQKMGVVFQQYNLYPHMTALQNVCLGPIYAQGIKRAEAEARGRLTLERVGLAGRIDAYPRQLSGGQQQRVAIARALAMQARVMLLDEATSALDPELVAEVEDVIMGLRDDGITMVMVTHSMSLARQLASRIAYVSAGEIAEFGPPERVLDDPQEPSLREFLRRIR